MIANFVTYTTERGESLLRTLKQPVNLHYP